MRSTRSTSRSRSTSSRLYADALKAGIKRVSLGGDHTIALPILRALSKVHGKLALVHVDAHADTNDTMFGEKVAHGTMFRRALEEGLVDGPRMFQIALRATGYSADDFDWARGQGATVVPVEECWKNSLEPLMAP